MGRLRRRLRGRLRSWLRDRLTLAVILTVHVASTAARTACGAIPTDATALFVLCAARCALARVPSRVGGWAGVCLEARSSDAWAALVAGAPHRIAISALYMRLGDVFLHCSRR